MAIYKWCVVPQCTNTSIKTPKKLFVKVPMESNRRKEWLNAARRNPDTIGANSKVYMCEDHFNGNKHNAAQAFVFQSSEWHCNCYGPYHKVNLMQLERDIPYYMKFKMGITKHLLVVDGALPTKFYCQKRQCDPSTSRAAFPKRQQQRLVEESEEEYLQHCTELPKTQDNETNTEFILGI